LALAVSTAGELFIPILVRRVMDDAVSSRSDLSTPQLRRPTFRVSISRQKTVLAAPFQKTDGSPFPADEARLVAESLLDPEDWYVFRYEHGDASSVIISERPELFEGSSAQALRGAYAAIRVEDLKTLLPVDRRTIRGNDYRKIQSVTVLFIGV
jgi:hypothetical protein